VKVELFPRAGADIIRQFRYYLVDQDAPLIAVRFREAVIESISRLKARPRIGSLFPGVPLVYPLVLPYNQLR